MFVSLDGCMENVDGWERFPQYHPFLIELCEVIMYGSSEFCNFNDGWSAEDKKNALAHLKALELSTPKLLFFSLFLTLKKP